MATWTDLVGYVRTRYEVMAQGDDTLQFNLATEGERTQLVSVHRTGTSDGHVWIQISSPIARAGDVDLRRLLELAGAEVVGGAAITRGVAVLRHAAPLDEMSYQEFELPFRLVVAIADDLERQLTGSDQH